MLRTHCPPMGNGGDDEELEAEALSPPKAVSPSAVKCKCFSPFKIRGVFKKD